jgi:hypothetical protein
VAKVVQPAGCFFWQMVKHSRRINSALAKSPFFWYAPPRSFMLSSVSGWSGPSFSLSFTSVSSNSGKDAFEYKSGSGMST